MQQSRSKCGRDKRLCGCGDDFLDKRDPTGRMRNRRIEVNQTRGMMTLLTASLRHRMFLLSPTAPMKPDDWLEALRIVFFLPASWLWWRSPSLSSRRCPVQQHLTSQRREMVPSGCQWEECMWRNTAGSPPVSIRKQITANEMSSTQWTVFT